MCQISCTPPRMVHPPKVKNQNTLLCIFMMFWAILGSFANFYPPTCLILSAPLKAVSKNVYPLNSFPGTHYCWTFPYSSSRQHEKYNMRFGNKVSGFCKKKSLTPRTCQLLTKAILISWSSFQIVLVLLSEIGN